LRWELAIVMYNMWNKILNPFFRLHEASDVLNKYLMGVCSTGHITKPLLFR